MKWITEITTAYTPVYTFESVRCDGAVLDGSTYEVRGDPVPSGRRYQHKTKRAALASITAIQADQGNAVLIGKV